MCMYIYIYIYRERDVHTHTCLLFLIWFQHMSVYQIALDRGAANRLRRWAPEEVEAAAHAEPTSCHPSHRI